VTELLADDYPRRFRPDIQALRAVAVLVVVLYHAHLPVVHGGFLGVDVFFVISGFVITGVLLTEHVHTHGVSLLDFYARRVRRIVPASSLVVVATVFASYHWLGLVTGLSTGTDAKWVLGFLGNVHFASSGLNYLQQGMPKSTLTQYWSLGVEEQFYVVWPLLFWATAAVGLKISRRTRLLGVISAVIVASLTYNLVLSHENLLAAFYSPFTRAWELGVGALLAIGTPLLARVGRDSLGLVASTLGYLGLAASLWVISDSTVWPGSAVLVPVAATALIIAGGSMRTSSRFGFLTTNPVTQWFGNVSYSLYLVHWPILVVVAHHSLSGSVSRGTNALLVLASIGAAAVLHYVVENPVRDSTWLKNHRLATLLMGAAFLGAALGAVVWHEHVLSW